MEYTKLAIPFVVPAGGGLDIKTAADLLTRGSYRIFKNLEVNLIEHAPCTRRPALYYDSNNVTGGNLNYGGAVHSVDVGPGTLYLVGAGGKILNQFDASVADSGYSGNPLALVDYRTQGNSTPWVIIGDFQKMSKAASVNGQLLIYKLGISPPGAVPPYIGSGAPAVSTIATGSGLLNSSTGVGYDWRYTYYSTATRSESNPSAIQAALLTVVNQSVDLVPGAISLDPQVTSIRWWRRGGTLGDTWRLVGQQANSGSATSTTLSIVASPNGLLSGGDINISSVSEVGNTVTAVLAQPVYVGLKVGDLIQVKGVGNAGYNGTFSISGLPGGNQIKYFNPTSGLPPSSGGQMAFQLFTCITIGVPPPPVGPTVTIAGAGVAAYNGTWNIRSQLNLGGSAHFTLAGNFFDQTASGGGTATISGIAGGFLVTNATWSAGTATISVTPDSGMLVGQSIDVEGVNPSGYNGVFTITAVGSLTISYALVGNPGPYVSGGTVVFNDNTSDVNLASNPVLSLNNDVPVTTVDSQNRTVYEQPLYAIWGPYTGGSIFGCGDPNQPGFLYWSNPFNIDGWSSLNNVEVSAPADGILNGFVWNSRNWVFSGRLLWEIFPIVIGSITGYQAFDAGAGHGLAELWAFAAGPDTPKVWYETPVSGIVEFSGGGPAVSITEEKLGPLFLPSNFSLFPFPVFEGLYPVGFPGAGVRMKFSDNELRFSYTDVNGGNNVLAYDIYKRTWRYASYPYKITCFYVQPFNGALILGGSDGGLYVEGGAFGGADQSVASANVPITCELKTGYASEPDYEAMKEYGDAVNDFSSNAAPVSFTALFADGTGTPITASISNGATRGQVPVSLQDGYYRDVAFDYAWASTQLVTLYGVELLYKLDIVPVTHMLSSASAWGAPGFFHVSPDGWLTIRSGAPVTVKFTDDQGNTFSLTLPSTGGAKQKFYLDNVPPNKMLLIAVAVDSTAAFRIYAEDSYLPVMPWGAIRPIEARPFAV